ncbi:MAG: lipoyl(octanoyl) transferase [Gemmatimonadetes bacterium]|nr:MAG: lipoyl(octanoyl) transferase [Gemmatimonadota bacterium]
MSERILEVVQAGRVPYGEALGWQRRLAQARIAGRQPHDLLLLLEHPPVVTLGRNSHHAHLLRTDGIEVFEVERGGDVTYHGLGQLVGYPILDLMQHRPDLHWYLRTLEQALIDALAELGIPAERDPGYTGVWTRRRKIASIGIHVKQWVTWHGFALNVTTDLGSFERIVPCGIPGVVMTSVEREVPVPARMGNGEKGMVTHSTALWDDTVAAVVRGFEGAFALTAKYVEERRRGETSREPVTNPRAASRYDVP